MVPRQRYVIWRETRRDATSTSTYCLPFARDVLLNATARGAADRWKKRNNNYYFQAAKTPSRNQGPENRTVVFDRYRRRRRRRAVD